MKTRHTCDQHPAGTATCAEKCLCRCRPCRTDRARYEEDRRNGVRRRVPTDTAQAAVDELKGWGWTHRQIAEGSGVSMRTIEDLSRRLRPEMLTSTSEAVVGLADDIRELRDNRRLDARRLVAAVEQRSHLLGVTSVLSDPTARRIYYRARNQGWISLRAADKLATVALGQPHLVDQLEPA